MRLGASRHINEEELEQYSLGTVPDEQLASVEEHLLVCETCQNRVQNADKYLAAMRRAAKESRQGTAFGRRRFGLQLTPVLAGAAAFAMAVTGWQVLRRGAVVPYRVELEATRGEGVLTKAPAGRALELTLEVATLPAQTVYRVEMVDASGRAVWRGRASAQDSKLMVSLPRLGAGYYFIRVYGLAGALLREYGLEVA